VAPPDAFPPMLARLVGDLPSGDGWLYEPKWDGF
jgi:ATP-dependent DNA ligase